MMSATTPATMTAIDIVEPGGPEGLKPTEMPTPEPGPGEILIKIAAAGLNRADVVQRQGFYPPPPGASAISGLEAAGTVAALGPGANRYALGDEVCALLPGGGYAEYCAVAESSALPVPTGFSMAEAAGLPEAFFTVWTNVFDRCHLQAGETFLVQGGSSGIGTTAIMLGKAFGARVFATAGSAEKCAACEGLGAERAINYKEEDFVTVLKEIVGAPQLPVDPSGGINVTLDMVGGSYVEKNFAVAALNGRIVNVAYLEGSKVEINLMPVMLKHLTLTGSTLRGRSVEDKAEIARDLEDQVWPLLNAGAIRPVIDSTFPLEAAGEAQARMETSAHIGKIILTV